jgi:DNA topoisomerase-3
MLRLHNTFRQFRIEYAEKGREPKVSSNKIGIALVEGYKQYGGYQLNKPDLRREMEAECNHVAAGRKYEEIMTSHSGKDAPVPRNGNSGKRTAGRSRRSPLPRLGSSNTTTQDASPLANAASVITKWRLQEINARGNNNARRKMVYCNTCSAGWNLLGRVQFHRKARTAALQSSAAPFATTKFKVMRGEGYEGNGYHVCPKCFSIQWTTGSLKRSFVVSRSAHHLRIGQWDTGRRREVFPCPFAILVAEDRADNTGNACARHLWGTCCLQQVCHKSALSVHSSGCPRMSQTVSIPEGDENQNTICPTCSTGGRLSSRQVHLETEAFRHISVGNAPSGVLRRGISTRVGYPFNRTKCKHGQGNNEVGRTMW